MKNEIVEVKAVKHISFDGLAGLIKREAFDMQKRGLVVEVRYSDGPGVATALLLGRKPE